MELSEMHGTLKVKEQTLVVRGTPFWIKTLILQVS